MPASGSTCANKILSNQSGHFGDGAGLFLSGLEVFDGGLVVVLQGDEPLGLSLKRALELFFGLG